ncbi:MFS transporter [Pandoraea apista]|uniref:4-hydroxybenzoate transporter n=1 Tax=Pandoraea apista TaxID=93218 RepID=A0A5E5PAD0_9BURK|nr:MFS transporter [Pandoraea apista]AJF00428.1 4-hydroxybenzoate transporter [Pandoraea apista]AKH74611.1 4-hydroxybenzoate transporter [Pandoraea apista]AKI63161.1 4-hydroxybenzoate transporter [Pandoraea apista]ALS64838.1 4-hydroxybenzoate transporter [Pandoraea apista]AVF41424.1 MFS transporter [Pandoraea apista]
MKAAEVNVGKLIDESRLGAYQWWVIALCAMCLVVDGFDVQAMGYVAPVVIREWGIAKETLSPVFGAGLFGMLVGSLTFSALADKLGRRPVLIGATLFFAVCMIFTGFANTITELVVWRFVAGLGLGCIMPNAMALAGEYSPRRIRVSLMMMVSCGFTLGGVVGGLITAAIIPSMGWRAVFFIGGAIPLVLGILMWISLPESIQFLMFKKSDRVRIRKQLLRVAPNANVPVDAHFVLDEQKAKGVPFIELFKDGRARVTLLLWVINFANLLDMYFLSNWLPTVIRDAGYSTQVAVMAGTALWAGGVIGTLLLGRVIDRVGFTSVLAVTFLIAIAATAAIGNPVVMVSMVAVFIAIFFAGFSIIGGQPALNALAATYYPTSLRSTGIGWSLGVGRIGSVLGPVLGGALMHLQWSSSSLFLAAAVPACVSLIGVLAIARTQRGDGGNLRTAAAN